METLASAKQSGRLVLASQKVKSLNLDILSKNVDDWWRFTSCLSESWLWTFQKQTEFRDGLYSQWEREEVLTPLKPGWKATDPDIRGGSKDSQNFGWKASDPQVGLDCDIPLWTPPLSLSALTKAAKRHHTSVDTTPMYWPYLVIK